MNRRSFIQHAAICTGGIAIIGIGGCDQPVRRRITIVVANRTNDPLIVFFNGREAREQLAPGRTNDYFPRVIVRDDSGMTGPSHVRSAQVHVSAQNVRTESGSRIHTVWATSDRPPRVEFTEHDFS